MCEAPPVAFFYLSVLVSSLVSSLAAAAAAAATGLEPLLFWLWGRLEGCEGWRRRPSPLDECLRRPPSSIGGCGEQQDRHDATVYKDPTFRAQTMNQNKGWGGGAASKFAGIF